MDDTNRNIPQNPAACSPSPPLFNNTFEKGHCGVGFIARIDGLPYHHIVKDAVKILVNLEHRGPIGTGSPEGDGAGLMIEIPDEFLSERDIGVESLDRTLGEFGIDGDPEAGAEIWRGKYGDADLFPEVEEVLHALGTKYPMVVTSNVDNDDLGYSRFRERELPFLAILTSESLRSYKPHGRIFKEALSIVGCQPEEVLHVGDSQVADVVGAKKAGMLAVWLNRCSDKLKSGIPAPDYEITDLRELLDLLL